jgi:hypothetical protein
VRVSVFQPLEECEVKIEFLTKSERQVHNLLLWMLLCLVD